MKKIALAIVALFFATAAYAQNPGSVTNNAFAIGQGPAKQGLKSVLCTAGQLPVGQAAAPICQTVTGDASLSAGGALTLATVNAGVGSFGSATQCATFTVNGKGLITAASAATCTPAVGSITGLGTGVAAALGVNVGSAGAFVTFGGALGSPSSIGTLPAFTLGGTIAGGGNQINNVVIGTSSPLGGTFTTATATTLVSSPVYRAATSLTLQSNGGTFAGSISTGQLWYMGPNNLAPAGTNPVLTVSKNAAAIPAIGTFAPLAHFAGVDGSFGDIILSGWGNGRPGGLRMTAARGTAASPTSLQTGDEVGFNFAYGYCSGCASTWAPVAGFDIYATENFASGANGTRLELYAAPNGSTTAVRVSVTGGLGVGTTAQVAVGLLYTNAATFMIGSKTSYANGAGAGAGTISNAPAAGNPTKWIPVDDNGTTRYVPAW